MRGLRCYDRSGILESFFIVGYPFQRHDFKELLFWELFWNLDYSRDIIFSFCFDEESITGMTRNGKIKGMILEAVGDLMVKCGHERVWLHLSTSDLNLDLEASMKVWVSERYVEIWVIG